MASTNFDLIIIGGGPIGLACALEAKKAKLNYTILEKGCLVNSLYHYPTNMTFFSTSERLEIGDVPFVSNNPKPTRAEALEYYRRVAVSYDLQLRLFEEVSSIRKTGKTFVVSSSKGVYRATNIVIATGFYGIPFKLNIPGEELPKLTHYYKDPHFYAMQNVLVVGAQNSAVDAALETWRKGASVTLVVRQSEIGKRVKYWVRPDILNRIQEGSIKAYFNSKVTEIRENDVDIETPEGKLTIANDWVIAMTGYEPDMQFLRESGVRVTGDACTPAYDEKTMESNVRGLYLAGVICGGMDTHTLFIENSRVHAKRIVAAIKKNRKAKPDLEKIRK